MSKEEALLRYYTRSLQACREILQTESAEELRFQLLGLIEDYWMVLGSAMVVVGQAYPNIDFLKHEPRDAVLHCEIDALALQKLDEAMRKSPAFLRELAAQTIRFLAMPEEGP